MGTVLLSINLRNRAVTQYHGISANSMCFFNGQALIGNATGMHELSYAHTDDNGTAIAGFAEFVATDLGLANAKTVRSALLSASATGPLRVSWTANESTTNAEDTAQWTADNVYKDVKLRGNHRVEGTYLQFKIENRPRTVGETTVRGTFLLNRLQIIPIVKSTGKNK